MGLLAVLWTASAYIGCFFRASAEIWGVERRPVWRAWPLRVALTVVFLVLLALALLIIVLTGQLASSIGDALGIEEGLLDLYGFLKWPALLVVVALLVALLYRTSPSGERSATHWRVLTPGGAVAVAAWVVVSVGFEVYVNAFATYDDHIRRAGYDDRGAGVAVAHEPDAADGCRARCGARVPEGR